jgi:hypothetical protein
MGKGRGRRGDRRGYRVGCKEQRRQVGYREKFRYRLRVNAEGKDGEGKGYGKSGKGK